jgi:hypothetical protein
LAKQYTTVHTITGEDLEKIYLKAKEKIGDGVEAAVEAIESAVEKGSEYRISVCDKDGDVKFKTTATVGAFGLSLSVLLLPVLTVVVGVIAALSGAIAEYKVVVEKAVKGAAPSESVKA